jgi:hypothetical protein
MKKHYSGATYNLTQEDMNWLIQQLESFESENKHMSIKLELAIAALEQINQEELNSQRPGGGYSKSAKISYDALEKLKD